MMQRRTDTVRPGGKGGNRNKATALERAYRTGLNLLARQAHSTRRLGEKLARRGHSETVINRVLKDFRRLGYLDDLRLAAAHLQSGSERRLLGRTRLESELLRHGMDQDTIQEALRRHAAAVDEGQVLDAALRRYLQRRGPLADPAAVRKGYHHLLRRGFSPAAIRQALDPHLPATGCRGLGRHEPIERE
jgi:regulatory protein